MDVMESCPNCGEEVAVVEGLQNCSACKQPFVARIKLTPVVELFRLAPAFAAVQRVIWGLHLEGVPWDMAPLERWVSEVSPLFRPGVLHWWHTWGQDNGYRPFAPEALEKCRQYGAEALITWSSEGSPSGVTQDPARWVLARILDGTHDAYIRQFARDCQAWGHRIYLRWGHDMNGSWGLPWQESQFGNRQGDFVRAWRHISDIFEGAGADNVVMVWCPGVRLAGMRDFESYFPGWDCVRYLGLDGYAGGGSPWLPFVELFGPSYDEISALAPEQPVMICEMGCAGPDAQRGTWLSYALSNVTLRCPGVTHLVYTNRDCSHPRLRPRRGRGDWRIEPGPWARDAWNMGVQGAHFADAADVAESLAALEFLLSSSSAQG